jgi:hypothetical protein
MKHILALAALILATPASAQDYRTDYNSPKLIAPDGTYLGNLNNNQFDPNSVNNPFGQYGNPFSHKSVNNPFSQYGNPYSQQYSNPNGRR